MIKTKDGKLLNVEILKRTEATNVVNEVLPALAKIITNYAAADDNFYKANYAFGADIIDNGKVYLPLANGGKIALNDPMLPETLALELNFNPLIEDPLLLVLTKKSELYYLPAADRIMSHAIIEPGSLLGIPRAIHIPEQIPEAPNSSLSWKLNAGARFLFMLTKIADKTKYTKLSKQLQVKIQAPTSTENQWDVFTNLARKCNSSWQCSLLFFPRKWITQIKTREWAEVSVFLMHRHRASYNIWHNKLSLWHTALNEIEKQKNLTIYAPYVLATARQLLYIAAKSSVGFRPATTDDSAPISFLQDIFERDYGLLNENQSSIIMEPAYINHSSSEPIYYSLNYPVLSEYKPDTFKGKSQIMLYHFLYLTIQIIAGADAF
jgi:hypothetical protein